MAVAAVEAAQTGARAAACFMGWTRERVLRSDASSGMSPGVTSAKGAAALVCPTRSLPLARLSVQQLMLLQVLTCAAAV